MSPSTRRESYGSLTRWLRRSGPSSSPAGARGAGCRVALERLAEQAGALLATSAVANGLFEGNPWSLGISGGFATPLAGELLRGADLVVGWGCALNMWTTSHGALIGPEAALVQVDVEPDALGRNRPISLGVVGDVRATATAAAASLPARTDGGYRLPDVADRIACQGAGATSPSRTRRRPSASTRASSASRSTTCSLVSAWWRSTRETSWATPAPTSRFPTSSATA